MSQQVIDATSAGGAMRDPQEFQLILPLEILLFPFEPGQASRRRTFARNFSLEDWKGVFEAPPTTGISVRVEAEFGQKHFDTRAAIVEFRRLSGLTWEKLAGIFGVTRRTLHFWASGRPVNAANEERLHRLLAVLRQADRGSAPENRAMLLRDYDGTIPLDLLASGRLDEFRELVGPGRTRRRLEPKPLSWEAQVARKPLPPEELVDALQDRVHRDIGRGRAARTVRSKRRGRDG